MVRSHQAVVPKPRLHQGMQGAEIMRPMLSIDLLRCCALWLACGLFALTGPANATVLAQLGGINLPTDPIFSERASPLSFAGPKHSHAPGLALQQLPHIDRVPLGLKAWLAEIGIQNAIEMDWWQSHRLGAVEVVMTPVQHGSGRR